MKLSEYASFDAMGLAELIKSGQVSTQEIRDCALRAVDAVNGEINAVIETYRDPMPVSPEPASDAPFASVPFLIKDVGLHFGGLKCEFYSRLCEGMSAMEDSHYARLVRRTGVSIVGRTNTPEFSMSGTSENRLYGCTSTPWKKGYSANGSSGGSAAAVSAGIVPIAHGSDIGGSIRGPAAWCGGIGLKPSRARMAQEFLAGESLHGLSRRHDVSRNLIRVWVAKLEAGTYDEDAEAADLLQEYEAKIAALERLVGRQALEIEFLKGALKSAPRPRSATTSVIAGPMVSPSPKDAD